VHVSKTSILILSSPLLFYSKANYFYWVSVSTFCLYSLLSSSKLHDQPITTFLISVCRLATVYQVQWICISTNRGRPVRVRRSNKWSVSCARPRRLSGVLHTPWLGTAWQPFQHLCIADCLVQWVAMTTNRAAWLRRGSALSVCLPGRGKCCVLPPSRFSKAPYTRPE
jgi:hypothetical protein